MEVDKLPSDKLKVRFDEELGQIIKNNKLHPFSVKRILEDLIEAGVSPLDALDILYTTRPYLKPRMQTEQLMRIINKEIKNFGYSDSEFLYATYFQPVEILFEDGNREIFNFKIIKTIVRDYFREFQYSSKTFRSLVAELHRIIKMLRAPKIKIATVLRMMPLVSRNTIAVDPFSKERCVDDYQNVVKLNKLLDDNWKILPDEEVKNYFLLLFESAFRVVLLSYQYLPGNSLWNTLQQIHDLVTNLTEHGDKVLSPNEVYHLGKSAKRIDDLSYDQFQITETDKLFKYTPIIVKIVHGLMNRGTIKWLIVSDSNGNELFSKFSKKQKKKSKKLLFSMAISGMQSIVSELTDRGIREIQQDEGNTIVIEKRKLFFIGILVEQSSHLVRQKIIDLANFIEGNLNQALKRFNGSVNIFTDTISEYVKSKMKNLFD